MSEEVITTLHAASMYIPTLNYLSLGPRPLSKAKAYMYLVVQKICCFIRY
jgi:hypothetical protein